MSKITALIFVFVIAAGLVAGSHPAFALDREKSIREIKAISGVEGFGEYLADKITGMSTGTKGDRNFVLCGIGGTTLDLGEIPSETPPKTPAEPLTPQPEPRGLGAAPPSPLPVLVTPGEVPGRDKIKEETGSQKPVTSKKTRHKRKEKGKTTAERVKKSKRVQSQSEKTMKKLSETSTGQDKAHPKRPTAWGVTKSLESTGAGRLAPKPEIKKHTEPSSKKKVPAKPATTQH